MDDPYISANCDILLWNKRPHSDPDAKYAMTVIPFRINMVIQQHSFEGPVWDIPAAKGCSDVDISGNTGLTP